MLNKECSKSSKEGSSLICPEGAGTVPEDTGHCTQTLDGR